MGAIGSTEFNAFLRVSASRKPLHITDYRLDEAYLTGDPIAVAGVELGTIRTLLIVPLLKDNELVGTFGIFRQEVLPFTDKQIALVQNFAAQAVIAIENTRLLSELRESLQQQTATADVLKVISRSTFNLQTVLDTLVELAARLCRADRAAIRLARDGTYHHAASYGFTPEQSAFMKGNSLKPDRTSLAGRVVFEGKAVRIADQQADPELRLTQRSGFANVRSSLGVPMLREGKPIGVLVLTRNIVEPFTDKQLELVTTFADQAVIAIENVRLFETEQERTRELSESLQRQTATAEVLRVISSSPGELEPVFRTILENTMRICCANFGGLSLREGDAFRAIVMDGVSAAFADRRQRDPLIRLTPGHNLERLVRTKDVVHIPDLSADMVAAPIPYDLAGARALLNVPLLKDNEVIGSILVYRHEAGPFAEKQIEFGEKFRRAGRHRHREHATAQRIAAAYI